MPYNILFSKSAFKELEEVPKIQYLKIKKVIDQLAENPRPVGVKKLVNRKNQYRIRTGDYRVIYSIFDDLLVIDIISVGHRKDIYL